MAYHDEDGYLVTDRLAIARHYAEWRLWVDLGTTIPFDWCAAAGAGARGAGAAAGAGAGAVRPGAASR